MNYNPPFIFPSTSAILPAAVALLAIGIFIVDTLTDLELATAVLYAAVVLFSSRFCRARGVLTVAAVCVALTLLSYLFAREGSAQTGVVNGIISLSTIAITTYLTLKIGSAQVAAIEARSQLARVARLTALEELAASITGERVDSLSDRGAGSTRT